MTTEELQPMQIDLTDDVKQIFTLYLTKVIFAENYESIIDDIWTNADNADQKNKDLLAKFVDYIMELYISDIENNSEIKS